MLIKLKWLMLIVIACYGLCACKKAETLATTMNITELPFNQVPSPEKAVIYQVNIRVFSSSRDLEGIKQRLDTLKSIGVNVLYLMPIYPVGALKSINSPYCIKNYATIDPAFGTLNDLRALVKSAHSKGMAVMLDWVANHTAWDHHWIAEHPEWYAKDSAGNMQSPPGTNWLDVVQLDFNQQAMRQAQIALLKFWITAANIDGYRFDYADGPPLDFWKQAIDSLRNMKNRKLLLLAEGTKNGLYQSGFDYTFGFRHYDAIKKIASGSPVSSLRFVNIDERSGAFATQRVVRYITNHDVNSSDGPPVQVFGNQDAAMAYFATVVFGTEVPMLYTGQEIGWPTRIAFPFTGQTINWSANPAIYSNYSKMFNIRKTYPVLQGNTTFLPTADVAAYAKTLGNDSAFVAINLRNSILKYPVPTNWRKELFNPYRQQNLTLTDSLTLPPYGIWIGVNPK